MTRVNVPGLGLVDFPDDMSNAEMEKAGVTSYRFHLDDEELVATAESKRKVKIRKTATPTLSIVTD